MTFCGWPSHLSYLFDAVDVISKEWESATPDCSCCQRPSATAAIGGIAALVPFHFQVMRCLEGFGARGCFHSVLDPRLSWKRKDKSSHGRIVTWRDGSETDRVRGETRWVCLRGPPFCSSSRCPALLDAILPVLLANVWKVGGEVRVTAMLNILRRCCRRIYLMSVCDAGVMDVEEKVRRKSNVCCVRMWLWLKPLRQWIDFIAWSEFSWLKYLHCIDLNIKLWFELWTEAFFFIQIWNFFCIWP